MRGVNYLAGIGTVFVFIGIFCFKAIFHKSKVKGYTQPKEISKTNKIILFISGLVSVATGLLLIIKAVIDIYN